MRSESLNIMLQELGLHYTVWHRWFLFFTHGIFNSLL